MRSFLFCVPSMLILCLLAGCGMKNTASPVAAERTYTMRMPADDPDVLMRMGTDAIYDTMESDDECETLTFVGEVFPPCGQPIGEIIEEQGSREPFLTLANFERALREGDVDRCLALFDEETGKELREQFEAQSEAEQAEGLQAMKETEYLALLILVKDGENYFAVCQQHFGGSEPGVAMDFWCLKKFGKSFRLAVPDPGDRYQQNFYKMKKLPHMWNDLILDSAVEK